MYELNCWSYDSDRQIDIELTVVCYLKGIYYTCILVYLRTINQQQTWFLLPRPPLPRTTVRQFDIIAGSVAKSSVFATRKMICVN